MSIVKTTLKGTKEMIKYYVLGVNMGTETEPSFCAVAIPTSKIDELWPKDGKVEDEFPCETRQEATWYVAFLDMLYRYYGVHYCCCGEDVPLF